MPTDVTGVIVETLVGGETGTHVTSVIVETLVAEDLTSTHVHGVIIETLVAEDYNPGHIDVSGVVVETLIGRLPQPVDMPVSSYTDINEQRFGRDLVLTLPRNNDEIGDTQPTATGDWPTVAGRPNLHAALRRRLITAPGEMVSQPDYGGGLPLYVGALNSPTDRASLANEARLNVMRDPRLDAALVTVDEVADLPQVIVELIITPKGEGEAETVTPSTVMEG